MRRQPAAPREHGPILVTVSFAAAALVFALGRATGTSELSLTGAIGVLCFGIAAAPFQLSRELAPADRAGLIVLVALTIALGLGALMADVRPLWHPVLAASLLTGAAVAIHVVSARRALIELSPRSRTGRTLHALASNAKRPGTPSVLVFLGTAVWLATAVAAGHIDPGSGGFLPKISPLWFGGPLLLIAALVLAAEDEREPVLAFAVVSLALATTLTPALLYAAPRSQSAAKHIDLVQLLLRHHHIHTGSGIYQAYSAFFAAIAWICRLAGVSDPFGLAAYWPVVLAFARVAVLRFLAGRLIADTRRRWMAVALVILVDAIGADYFSPQSVGYVMAIAICALFVSGPQPGPLTKRSAVALLALASCALAPTHELSPFVVAGVLAVLTGLGLSRFRWAAAVAAVPAIAWAAVQHKVLGSEISLDQFLNPSNFAPPQTTTQQGLPRLAIVGLSSHALALGIVVAMLLALAGLAANRRARWAWACALAPAVGLAFVAVNPYGNEGIFRAALFAIPWLAILAAGGVRPHRAISWIAGRRVTCAALASLGTGLFATFAVAAYGMDGSSVLRRQDLAAARAFEFATPLRSLLVTVGYGDNPAAAPLFDTPATSLTWDQIVPRSSLAPGRPVAADLRALIAACDAQLASHRASPSSRVYALWTPALEQYSREYGLQSASQSRDWLRLLRTSSSWQPVFAQKGTYMFELRAAPGGSS